MFGCETRRESDPRPRSPGRGSIACGPDADGGEESLAGVADNFRLRRGVLRGDEREQAATGARAEQLVQQILEGAALICKPR